MIFHNHRGVLLKTFQYLHFKSTTIILARKAKVCCQPTLH